MAENKSKESFMAHPVERHDTAAWRGHIEKIQSDTNVGIPSEIEVRNAKEWVDSNQK